MEDEIRTAVRLTPGTGGLSAPAGPCPTTIVCPKGQKGTVLTVISVLCINILLISRFMRSYPLNIQSLSSE